MRFFDVAMRLFVRKQLFVKGNARIDKNGENIFSLVLGEVEFLLCCPCRNQYREPMSAAPKKGEKKMVRSAGGS